MRRALAFLTPLGGAVAPAPSALAWFPVVGAAIGLALGGIWWLALRLWAPPVAAAIVVAADLALTGMLHLDGLVDSADGLLPPLVDRARRLEVMSDPAAGAFGVGTAVTVLGLRWAALAALAPSAVLLGALWSASRLAMAVAARSVPYARPGGGLATAFLDPGPRSRNLPIAGILLGAVLTAAGRGDAVLGVAVLGVSAAAVVGLASRRIGGFTGDVLGAAGMVGETLGLLAAAAHR
jgi:adenosylcobinamide-GDP ribazoletransferase